MFGYVATCDTEIKEEFKTEFYRLRDHSIFAGVSIGEPYGNDTDETNGIYDTQISVSSELGVGWQSVQALNTNTDGYIGLMCFNGTLRSPNKTDDIASITDGNFNAIPRPANNVDYSTGIGSSEIRWFYRAFKNTSLATEKWKVTITGSNKLSSSPTIIVPFQNNGATYGTGNITVEIKVPGKTAWLDCAVTGGGSYGTNGLGVLQSAYPGAGNSAIIANGTHYISPSYSAVFICDLQATHTVANGSYIVMRIAASEEWVSALKEIEIDWAP